MKGSPLIRETSLIINAYYAIKKLLEIEQKVGNLPYVKAYLTSKDVIKVSLPANALQENG